MRRQLDTSKAERSLGSTDASLCRTLSCILARNQHRFKCDETTRNRQQLKGLSQILKQRARQLEICGFETFREAIVDDGQRIPGLLALAVFGEQACQGHR